MSSNGASPPFVPGSTGYYTARAMENQGYPKFVEQQVERSGLLCTWNIMQEVHNS